MLALFCSLCIYKITIQLNMWCPYNRNEKCIGFGHCADNRALEILANIYTYLWKRKFWWNWQQSTSDNSCKPCVRYKVCCTLLGGCFYTHSGEFGRLLYLPSWYCTLHFRSWNMNTTTMIEAWSCKMLLQVVCSQLSKKFYLRTHISRNECTKQHSHSLLYL
jgi:hypothetical protein